MSGVGLGAALLQTRHGTSCPRDKAPDNSILRPIAFVGKSLSSTEKRYSHIERVALGILHGLEKFHHYCFAREVSIITDHTLLVAIFTKTQQCYQRKNTLNFTQNTPIQSQNHIQAWIRFVHNRLAFQTKPQGKQRCRNTWHAVKYLCNTNNY